MGIRPPLARDLVGIGMIPGELENQSVGVRHVDRAAVAMLEYEGIGGLDAGLFYPRLDGRLRLSIHLECDMVERRLRSLKPIQNQVPQPLPPK